MVILKSYRKGDKTGKLVYNDNEELEYIGDLPLLQATCMSISYSSYVNEILTNQLLSYYQAIEAAAE
ncbi:hypothetical protein [Desulfatirhabdium butyrativorans]|uniref:hypothetical protein n=1 Tax=Desulfatirhabdium butyrativorans TaxID=340467 RepID=UPI0004874ABA|nr:hypothetical protein [Desulfatirhabdium butyrativorans]